MADTEASTSKATEVRRKGAPCQILSALTITAIQFRCITAEHPKVSMGSVIDDRNFRGPCASVVDAAHAAIEFDKMAGLTNNLKKFVLSLPQRKVGKDCGEHSLMGVTSMSNKRTSWSECPSPRARHRADTAKTSEPLTLSGPPTGSTALVWVLISKRTPS